MRITTLLASAALAAASFALPASAALTNPGFEAGVSGTPDATPAPGGPGDQAMSAGGPWSGWNNWVAPFSAYYTGVVAHSGTQAAKTFSGPNAGVFQSAPATAGQEYTASAWFLNRAADAMTAGQTADIRMIFHDAPNAAGNVLATLVTPVPVTNLTPQDVWTPLAVTGLAPAGTQSVVVMAFFNNPNFGGGAMHVDDMDLVAVPEPAGAVVAGIGVLGLLARRRRRQ